MNGTARSMVRITPLTTNGVDHQFAIASNAAGMAKTYDYDTRTEALRARGKAIKRFKDAGFLILQ